MIKKKIISAHNDLKTSIFSKILLVFGILFLIIYLIGILLHPYFLSSALLETFLAFFILFLGGSAVLWFFSRQFAKLSDIATEIEQDETLQDDLEETPEESKKN